MERVNFGYSLKNIAAPSPKVYHQMMINSCEKTLNRMRWKAFFYLNPDKSSSMKENFGLPTSKPAPKIEELDEFREGMLNLLKTTETTKKTNDFQEKLRHDYNKMKKEDKVFVAADKTANFYKVKVEDYNKLLENSITNDYKKTTAAKVKTIAKEDKKVAEKFNVDDRTYQTTEREAFATLKDHKDNFRTNPKCRLLNPTKPEIGKISKKILERINAKIKKMTGHNQWKNTQEVLKWFANLKQKHKLKFVQFDVENFYPSISEELLEKAIDYAMQFDDISQEEREVIFQSKKSSLHSKGQAWTKKGDSQFDVTMGSFDGAETCELVGLYLLSLLQDLGVDIGLYRDDGLGACRKTPFQMEKIKKQIQKVFRDNGLNVIISVNLTTVDFLDVTLDLKLGTYKPFSKPNDVPLYIHAKSNHPPPTLRNVPLAVNKRLSEISSNEDIFNEAAPIYQKALKDSGYNHTLKFSKELHKKSKTNRQRKKSETSFG